MITVVVLQPFYRKDYNFFFETEKITIFATKNPWLCNFLWKERTTEILKVELKLLRALATYPFSIKLITILNFLSFC
jgi:hypothetical protein